MLQNETSVTTSRTKWRIMKHVENVDGKVATIAIIIIIIIIILFRVY